VPRPDRETLVPNGVGPDFMPEGYLSIICAARGVPATPDLKSSDEKSALKEQPERGA
jgi:hypothetical protein